MGHDVLIHEVGMYATDQNLHEVVALLRPDLCLVPRRALDAAISLLVQSKHGVVDPLG